MLKHIYLKNYCQHSSLKVVFTKQNIIYGLDQSGKSSILNAIFSFTNSWPQLVKNPTDLILKNQTYASIEGLFKLNNQEIKQKKLIQENKISFYCQEKQVDYEQTCGVLPIVLFSQEKNLFVDWDKQKNFLILATCQVFPVFVTELKVFYDQLREWKKKVNTTNWKINAYHLSSLKEIEKNIANGFYQIIQKQTQLINYLNEKITTLVKNCFFSQVPFFKLKITLCQKLDLVDQTSFVTKVEELFLELREQKKIDFYSQSFVNSFVFVFSSKQKPFSSSQRFFLDLIVQLALAKTIEDKRKNPVLFLFDNFGIFDYQNQNKLWKIMTSFSQFIITCNQKIWEHNLLGETETSIHKIKSP